MQPSKNVGQHSRTPCYSDFFSSPEIRVASNRPIASRLRAETFVVFFSSSEIERRFIDRCSRAFVPQAQQHLRVARSHGKLGQGLVCCAPSLPSVTKCASWNRRKSPARAPRSGVSIRFWLGSGARVYSLQESACSMQPVFQK